MPTDKPATPRTRKAPARSSKPAAKPAAARKPATAKPAKDAGSASDAIASAASGVADFARSKPGLAIGGAILAGLIAGALMPRGTTRRIAKGAATAAALGSEVSLSLARQAREGAKEAAEGAGEHLKGLEHRASAGARRTVAAASMASNAGLDLARAALRYVMERRR